MSEKYNEDIEELELEEENDEKEINLLKEILSTALYILAVLAITFLIVKFVGQRTVVIGDSMMETLHNGDNLIIDKITYVFNDPERFDIVVFPYQYEDDTNYIKRIIGLPNETVYIDEEGNIYIDGELLTEHYGREVMDYAGLAATPITLGADEYFVLGDNRNASEDSRFEDVGIINGEDIIGRAIFRIYPFNAFGKIKNGND